MRRIMCFKCGSTRVDDGRSYLVFGLGLCLIVAAFLSILVFSVGTPVSDWTTYNPVEHTNPQVAAVMSLGIFMSVKGLTRSKRVRCRKCGTIWTPIGAKLHIRSR